MEQRGGKYEQNHYDQYIFHPSCQVTYSLLNGDGFNDYELRELHEWAAQPKFV